MALQNLSSYTSSPSAMLLMTAGDLNYCDRIPSNGIEFISSFLKIGHLVKKMK
jgi:hypothetical protein